MRPAPFRCLVPWLFVTFLAHGQDVLTGGYDLARTNAAPDETVLSPQSLSTSSFGKLFQLPADGQIYAQPLYQRNLTIAGRAHNVVFIATTHNSVYAYDADTAALPLWTVNLGTPVPASSYDDPSGEGPYTDITPEIGILGTPVIDPNTGTLYVVAATLENGAYYHRLHALDTATGKEKFGAPQAIQAKVNGFGVDNVNGIVAFNPKQHIQRPALLLLNGVVYIAFGSHGDAPPWHGWIMGYNAANVTQQTAVFNATPNSYGGSIWQSGRGLSADSQGNIYAITANGETNEVTDFSDMVLKLNSKDLSVTDWFAPYDVQTLDDDDQDLGSTGALLLPNTNLMLTGGKEGVAYLLNTNNLGHIAPSDNQIPQSFPAANVGVYNMALWNTAVGPVFYLLGGNSPLAAYPFRGGQFASTPSSQSSSAFDVPYNGITVSANGGKAGSGIVWVTTADNYPLPSNGTLHAYDAGDLSSELWNSSINPDRDFLGIFTKFANPTVVNGKVYVAGPSNGLAVYGQLGSANGGGAVTPVITGLVNAASYANGSVAPGEIVDIFGSNLGPPQLAIGTFDVNGNLATGLAGMQVTFNNVPAPIVYASAQVMAVIVPFEVSATDQTDVQVSYNGMLSTSQTLNVVATAPSIFTDDSSGRGQAAALNSDDTLNSASNPASAGDWVAVYATGGGQSDPPDSTGAIAQGIAQLSAPVIVTIGGQPATVLYAGHAPGEVAGVMQLNIVVPPGITGIQPIIVNVGGVNSPATATLAIQ